METIQGLVTAIVDSDLGRSLLAAAIVAVIPVAGRLLARWLKNERLRAVLVQATGVSALGIALLTGALVFLVSKRVTEIDESKLDEQAVKAKIAEAIRTLASAPENRTMMRFEDSKGWDRFGNWSEAQTCDSGFYVCGLKQKMEAYRGSGHDDSAINAIAIYCCPLYPSVPSRP